MEVFYFMSNDVLYEYESILLGKQKIFLLSFDDQTPEKHAAFRAVWQYAIEKILKWTPEEALINMDKAIMEDLKLDRTLKCIGLNPSGRFDFRQVLSYVYPERIKDSLEIRTKEEMKRVLKLGEWKYMEDPELGKFHKGFFSGEDGIKKAAIALNLVTNLFLCDLDSKERYDFFADRKKAMRFISQAKLLPVMKGFYDDPLDFYHFSIPMDEKDQMVYYEDKIRSKAKKIEQHQTEP